MIRTIILISVMAAVITTGCKNDKKSAKNGTKGSTSGTEQMAVKRDTTINKSNSYNDIFLNSADVEGFISTEKLNDTLSAAIRGFYNTRNFEYAWFSSTGLIEQAFSFHSLYCTEEDNNPFNKSLEARLDKLRMAVDTIAMIDPKNDENIKTELQLTLKFIQYALENKNTVNSSPVALALFIPAKKVTISDLADTFFVYNKNKERENLNEAFSSLIIPLQKYADIATKGGWPTISARPKKYNPGTRDPAIPAVKRRLQITGELTGTDTSALFDSGLVAAVKAYQQNHGFKPTGIITADLIKDLNIPALTRVQQILINMQRTRWMPTRPHGKLIVVNIPEFEVYVDSAGINLFHMDVVVGAQGHNTTLFSGNINQIVFSPYWDIPPSIVKKEILPGMKRDKNYLEERDMEITGHEGGLPVVRQKPGDKCALGKVKFLFPNSFSIYMHDSPEKGFFKRNERDLSHGCIRLSDAPKMAHYLLQNTPAWPPGKIDSAMNSGVEQFVKLRPTVPVIITYYTTWVDKNGTLDFADDIYGHDKKMAQKMFLNPQ